MKNIKDYEAALFSDHAYAQFTRDMLSDGESISTILDTILEYHNEHFASCLCGDRLDLILRYAKLV